MADISLLFVDGNFALDVACFYQLRNFLLQVAELLQHGDHSEPDGDVDHHHLADQRDQEVGRDLLPQTGGGLADICHDGSVFKSHTHHLQGAPGGYGGTSNGQQGNYF